MTVTLPTWPGPKSASLTPVDAGTWQHATLGGEDVRLDRLGDRFRLAVALPPMKWHTIDGISAARVWAARLARGISEGVKIEVPQPDFDTSFLPASLAVSPAAAQSVIVEFTGGVTGTTIPEGAMVTLHKAATGKNYLHQVRANATIDGGGAAFVSLWPRTRVALVAGDTVLIRTPVIDGRIVDPAPVDMDEARFIGLSFEIQEVS